ncbi:MAG: cob(I)yrinic acid a,c-diamide adenosyltransferase [Candidatus Aureabacteria bacterium]|nr:cob(I)yrinic acid a,c-diamide adenosyltransferase [Candidatus Auribacterota bacterium]
MKITTKKGDNGTTSQLKGKPISKDDIKIEAIGTVDELCSFIGMAKSIVNKKTTKNILTNVQKDLFVIGSEIVSNPSYNLKKRIDTDNIKILEAKISYFEKNNKKNNMCFVISGKNLASSTVDVARTVARKLERRIVTLKKKKKLKNKNILIYLNRLSDLLFLIARSEE